MPSRKRKVNIEENIEPDGDRNVKIEEERSIDSSDQQNEEEQQEDERYSPSSGS